MCAINPAFKKRIILDIYTSDKRFTQKEFDDYALSISLSEELRLNELFPRLRFHVKETNQEAD